MVKWLTAAVTSDVDNCLLRRLLGYQ